MSFWSKNIPIPNEINSNVFPGIYLKISYHQSRQWFGAARQQGKFYLKQWWVITDKESIRNMTSVGQKKLRPQPHEIEEYILKYHTGKARKSVVNYRAVIQSLIGIAVKAKLKNADTHFILLTSYKHSPSDHPKIWLPHADGHGDIGAPPTTLLRYIQNVHVCMVMQAL